jgi:hypothetical protein
MRGATVNNPTIYVLNVITIVQLYYEQEQEALY